MFQKAISVSSSVHSGVKLVTTMEGAWYVGFMKLRF